MTFGIEARSHFLLDPDVTFLNHGSFGATPRVVLDEQSAVRARMESEPVRFFVDEVPPGIRHVADMLGQQIGADGRDIAWVDNATTGTNAVIASARLGPGDAVLTTTHVYGAVDQCLRHHASRRGFDVIRAEVPFPVGSADEVVDAVLRACDPRVKLAVIDHITSFSGLVWPIERIVEGLRARGVQVCVDGAHAIGQVDLDLAALGADFYVTNAHKWLFAAKGCAAFWVRRDRQADLHPVCISHGYLGGFVEEFDFVGTKDPSPWLSLPTALRFVDEMGGLPAIRDWQQGLLREAVPMLEEAWGVTAPAPHEMRAALATLPLPGPAHEAKGLRSRLLSEFGVEVPVFPWGGRWWIRVSAQIYNTPEQYERVARAVIEAQGI